MGAENELRLLRGRPVERLIFGTEDESEISHLVARFISDRVGLGVRETLFKRTSVGTVVGLELEDGRRVVLKAHQARQSIAFLRAVCDT